MKGVTAQTGIQTMSVRMSVVLPEDLFQTVKTLSHHYKSWSAFVETALRRFINQIRREEQHQANIFIEESHDEKKFIPYRSH
jgi:metal-responsive CopG/Arc/MetJ family transcriptional regulator